MQYSSGIVLTESPDLGPYSWRDGALSQMMSEKGVVCGVIARAWRAKKWRVEGER